MGCDCLRGCTQIFFIPLVSLSYAPWCGACKQFGPRYEAVANTLPGDLEVKLAKVDVDGSPGLASKFFVTRLPTLFHIKDHQGKEKIFDSQPTQLDTWRYDPLKLIVPILCSKTSRYEIERSRYCELLEEQRMGECGSLERLFLSI